jgi:hypothetical protein
MKVERHNIKACCGTMAVILKTDAPLSKEHILSLIKLGFVESAHFTQAGILYMDNLDFILTGPLGSDRLTVKCKHKESDCTKKFNDLEVLLQQVG